MKWILLFTTALFISVAFVASKNEDVSEDAILGTWNIESGEAKVKIFKENNKFHGKVAWMKEPYDEKGNPKKDTRNQDEKLRNRPLLGMIIIRDMIYNPKEKIWQDGKVYKPGFGQEADCIISLIDFNTLKVKGFIAGKWLSETQTWKRSQ